MNIEQEAYNKLVSAKALFELILEKRISSLGKTIIMLCDFWNTSYTLTISGTLQDKLKTMTEVANTPDVQELFEKWKRS